MTDISLSSPKKATIVQQMFNRIANTYDLLNDCMTIGLHRQWKAKACQLLKLPTTVTSPKLLDVCTGTGDLIQYLKNLVGTSGEVVGIDFSESMLAVAKKRFKHDSQVHLLQGDALSLPFEPHSFDGAIIAFGLRNVSHIPTAISELARVVKPNGYIVSLDTNPNPKIPGFWFYFRHIMPMLGKLISQDSEAYGYLCQSTESFLSPEKLQKEFQKAGLQNIDCTPLLFGSAIIVSGQRASQEECLNLSGSL